MHDEVSGAKCFWDTFLENSRAPGRKLRKIFACLGCSEERSWDIRRGMISNAGSRGRVAA